MYHDENTNGQLAIEDKLGKRQMIPQRGWEDQVIHEDEDVWDDAGDDDDVETPQRVMKKVIKPRERYSNEL